MNKLFNIGNEYSLVPQIGIRRKIIRSKEGELEHINSNPDFTFTPNTLKRLPKLLDKINIIAKAKNLGKEKVKDSTFVLIHKCSINDYRNTILGYHKTLEEYKTELLGFFLLRGNNEGLYALPLLPELFTNITRKGREAKGYVYSTLMGKNIPLKKAVRFLNSWIDFNDEQSPFFINNSKYVLNSMSNVKDYISNDVIDSDDAYRLIDTISINKEGIAKITYKYTRCLTDISISLMARVNIYTNNGVEDLTIDNSTLNKYRNILTFSNSSGTYYTEKAKGNLRSIPYNPFNHMLPPLEVDTECKDLKAYVSNINKKYGTETVTNLISEQKPYTFGVEIETSGGCVPIDEIVSKHINVKSVRDGSISGGEYVTGVLKGDQGFVNLKKLTSILTRNCSINTECGIHVHLGNFSFSKENIIFAYILCTMLEPELMDMMPNSRRDNRYCTALRRDLFNIQDIVNICKPTTESKEHKELTDTVYSKLYNYLLSNNIGITGYSSRGVGRQVRELVGLDNNGIPQYGNVVSRVLSDHNDSSGRSSIRKRQHPGGHYGLGHNTARYNWLNIIPCNFRQKNKAQKQLFTMEETKPLQLLNTDKVIVKEYCDLIDKANKKAMSKVTVDKRLASSFEINRSNMYPPRTPYLYNERNINYLLGHPQKPQQTTAAEEGGFTIEFRLHSATMNYTKISNWILICMGIISFVENKKQLLINAIEDSKILTLEYIISKTYSQNKAKFLIDYINQRKRIFTAEMRKNEEDQTIKDSTSESILDIIKNNNHECV
jgi:hypothetical protein